MSIAAPTVLPIFAMPLGIVPIAAAVEHSAAVSDVLARRMAAVSRTQRNPFCYQSSDDVLEWPDEPVRALIRDLINGVYAVVGSINDLSDAQLRSFALQARAWFTVVRSNGCVSAISYPLTTWCAVYCVAAPAHAAARADSGVLRLYESRLGTMFQDATNSVLRVPFRSAHYSWHPVPGEMVVFPASLTHEIALLRSPGELVFITLRLRFVAPGQSGLSRW